MIETILGIISQIAKPLSPELLLVAIISGLLFGALYNHKVKVPKRLVYHKFVAGVWFIFSVYIFRVIQALATAGALTTVTNPAGWIGIALLWGLFCLFIWIGQSVREAGDVESSKNGVPNGHP